jgi:hypothetical protein
VKTGMNMRGIGSTWGMSGDNTSLMARSRRLQAEMMAMQAHVPQMPGMPIGGGFGVGSFGGMPMPGATTGTMVVDEQLQQKVYQDIISGAILTTSQILLYGTGVVVANFNARYSPSEEGTTVYVPYFDPMGPMQTLTPDGMPGVPQKVESSEEQNVIRHGYIGMAMTEMTELFSPFGGMIPGEFQAQARVRNAEWADQLLVTEAMTKATAADSATNPQSKRYKTVYVSSGAPAKFRRQLYIDSLAQRGAFGFSNAPALLIVHTDVIADMLSVNDAIGNMNLVSGAEQMAGRDLTMVTTSASPTGLMLAPFNIPIAVSGLDIFKPVAASSGVLAKYRSLMLYPRALGWRQNPRPMLLTDGNIHVPTKEAAIHFYAVAHAYKRADMIDLPGVFCIEHN